MVTANPPPYPYMVNLPPSFYIKAWVYLWRRVSITKFCLFTNKRFSKKDCLEYHYCLITIIIIIIVIIIIITIIIMVIMIIILIIIFNMIFSSSSLSLISLSPLEYHYLSIIYNIIWEQTCFHPYLLYQSDPESYGKRKNCDQE